MNVVHIIIIGLALLWLLICLGGLVSRNDVNTKRAMELARVEMEQQRQGEERLVRHHPTTTAHTRMWKEAVGKQDIQEEMAEWLRQEQEYIAKHGGELDGDPYGLYS